MREHLLVLVERGRPSGPGGKRKVKASRYRRGDDPAVGAERGLAIQRMTHCCAEFRNLMSYAV